MIVLSFVITDAPARERVDKGAALLDENVPGWISHIDLDRLSIADPNNCIVGQLYGVYHIGIAALDYPPPCGYGFNGDDYSALNEAWRALITARRAEAQPV